MIKYFRGIRFTPFLLFSLVNLTFAPFQALAETELLDSLTPAQLMLKRMVDANQHLSYKGRFTYEHGGALRTLEVLHQLENGQISERLTHLNGPQRELVHYQDQADCQKPGEMLLRGLPVDIAAGDYLKLTDNYELLLKGQGRIAGRTVEIMHILPKDRFRYGYSLALDEQTGLLLQSLLIDENKKVLERFQFVQLELNPAPDEAGQTPANDQAQAKFIKMPPCKSEANVQNLAQRWQTSWLPPGFILSDFQSSPEPPSETHVYSDGLAVFTVFIDTDIKKIMPEIQAQRGATVAFLVHKNQGSEEYLVCVVGEVPSETVRKVAMAISQVQEVTP